MRARDLPTVEPTLVFDLGAQIEGSDEMPPYFRQSGGKYLGGVTGHIAFDTHCRNGGRRCISLAHLCAFLVSRFSPLTSLRAGPTGCLLASAGGETGGQGIHGLRVGTPFNAQQEVGDVIAMSTARSR